MPMPMRPDKLANIEAIAENIYSMIPPAMRKRIDTVKGQAEAERWMVGDIADEMIQELWLNNPDPEQYPPAAIYMAVGQLFGAPVRQVKDRLWIARKVYPALRSQYHLNFHLWRACMGAGDNWMAIADQIEEYYHAYGRLPRWESAYSWAKGSADKDLSRPVWMWRVENLAGIAEKINADQAASDKARLCARLCLRALDRLGLREKNKAKR